MRMGRTSALVAAAAIAVAGCGGSEEKDPSPGLTPPPESADINVKPVIPKPTGPPPKAIQSRDVVRGSGKVAEQGDTLTVDYVGVSWSTGQEFDTSWGKEPFKFQLGAGMVIPGWDQGLVGMPTGGRRELVIPPDQAYGPQGQPPVIGPNETLVFMVDLKKVQKAK